MAQQQEFPAFEDDLAFFSNTDFYDFDVPVPISDLTGDIDFANSQSTSTVQPAFEPTYYNSFPAAVSAPNSLPPSPPNGIPKAGQIQQSQPTVPSPQQFANILAAPSQQAPHVGQKRKATIPNAAELEQHSRVAAEEDKRRRNTAASARFRVKKKQREQALEQTAKEMTDRVHFLEVRVEQLEMENKWLRGLVTDKNLVLEGGPSTEDTEEEDQNAQKPTEDIEIAA